MEEKNLRLHVPGHIGGKGMCVDELKALANIDITEVPGTDDLHLPQGIIAEAQQLLARACGARQSLMLLNGATSGIHALFMTLCDGERVLIPRNAHRSFYGGMVLSGAIPIYIPCEFQPELGIAVAVNSEEIEKLLHQYDNVGAVFITSPSYYGTCCDIGRIAAIVKRWQKVLFVDEAHGGHFPFHPLYPNSALKDGADAVVNGLHKTWPVLTQGACLHMGQGFKKQSCLVTSHSLITTTSPSYLLMASIDLARDFMEREGTTYLNRGLELGQEYRSHIKNIPGIRCYGDDLLQIRGVKALDPLKVLIGVQGLSLTGFQLADRLREEYHIQVETADRNSILAMFSCLHEREDWERFYEALNKLAGAYPANGFKEEMVYQPPLPPVIMSPRQAFFATTEKVKLAECQGRIAGEMVAAYPPGIPSLTAG
ncbi:MAG: aminotransferase class I/II-fold pyridoxal phosphate-dependent enzyme, partial [Syntrophomonas sp.]|nr:aminotransferase class I/II-fold pyridoxal phosphate-dependent enzyme [Syntrophomonas sp.]